MNKKKRKDADPSDQPGRRNSLSARRFIIGLIAGVLLLSGVAAFARNDVRNLFDKSPRPVVKVTLSGAVERGRESLPVEKAGEVKSGEVLRWKLISENSGDAAAADYKAVGQIPAGTVFVADSAKSAEGGGVAVTYSIDGGKTFSAQPVIEEKQSDGSMKQVAAPPEMYTQVRFEAEKPLDAGAKFDAFYSVRVR